ncbi:hypothetical protein SteCoe_12259 [Stentor coeruleus]|uniref:Uncharacterized protein n=1 Tax=Stentor coeruleus TaxID=5963 RepID=A0A1R2CB94_9CILI|nr:hypothetical protein SteCoe_12259 [Stentor coeruleus]
MGCCIANRVEGEYCMYDLRIIEEKEQLLERAVKEEFFSLSSSSSIIVFEVCEEKCENSKLNENSIKYHKSTEKTLEEW